MLKDDVMSYLGLRHAVGYKAETVAKRLKNFVTFAEGRGDQVVYASTVLEWAVLASSPQESRRRLLAVRRFALSASAENPCHEVPAADALGRIRKERTAPYIFTADEIARLLQAAARMKPQGSIRPVMYATLFGLLAATGLRVSEALALKCKDITGDGMIIRETKFKKSRLVPVHETTRGALDAYLSVRNRHKVDDDAFFISASGHAPAYKTVQDTFLRLARSIGLRGESDRRRPRIHDLRHTFAVRSLESCGTDRDDVARHTVALSTYLGHACVSDTYWYLEATPILTRQIADACEALHQGGAA